jgi:hypothetical protein
MMSSKVLLQGDRPLNLPMNELVIYEAHMRGFTADPASEVASPGTYLGMVERLDYLRDLGITAIELLPIFEFNELEYYDPIPGTDLYRYNFWGYSTVAFFAPMARFSAEVLSCLLLRSAGSCACLLTCCELAIDILKFPSASVKGCALLETEFLIGFVCPAVVSRDIAICKRLRHLRGCKHVVSHHWHPDTKFVHAVRGCQVKPQVVPNDSKSTFCNTRGQCWAAHECHF